jgi:hypothetical protein
MRGKAERDPRRERIGIRDRADRSDNTASRACRFEISAERFPKDSLFFSRIPQLIVIQSIKTVQQKPVRYSG